MIIGAHSIIYSKSADADRAFLRDMLELSGVDVGGGWLIFGLPPAELAVHPSDENDVHEFYFMCDDVEALVTKLSARGVACSPVQDQGWGRLTQVTLPGGGQLGIYQPRHVRPPEAKKAAPKRKPAPKKQTAIRPKKTAAKPKRSKARR